MPRKALHKAVTTLLLLAMLMQPALAFGPLMENTPESHAHTMDMMDCCHGENPASNPLHSEPFMECGDMTSMDCALAASLGGCGVVLPALVSDHAAFPTPATAGPQRLHFRLAYLSVILDTLTPPPNSSKA